MNNAHINYLAFVLYFMQSMIIAAPLKITHDLGLDELTIIDIADDFDPVILSPGQTKTFETDSKKNKNTWFIHFYDLEKLPRISPKFDLNFIKTLVEFEPARLADFNTIIRAFNLDKVFDQGKDEDRGRNFIHTVMIQDIKPQESASIKFSELFQTKNLIKRFAVLQDTEVGIGHAEK